MKIEIEYESSWRNSFLDGDNNSPLPKKGRDYLGSMTTLKKEGNFIKREITIDTIMGILNRLIGDQKKLYQARNKVYSDRYYFEHLENRISFDDHCRTTQEIVYVRNMKGSTDQNSFTGLIKSNDPMFTSEFSSELWGVLKLNLDQLCEFIIHESRIDGDFEADPIIVSRLIEELGKEKPLPNESIVAQAISVLNQNFPDAKYLNSKGDVKVSSLFCSALYLQIGRLAKIFDLSGVLTKSGKISGFSKQNFTKKDFMDRYTTGGKKKLFGNPFIKKERIKGEGEVTSMLTKAHGKLEINIDVDRTKAKEITNLIENAGVSSFYIGKKGLAYVTQIDTRK